METVTETLRVPRHLRKRGDEGYRTPTIEDIEEDGGSSGFPFPEQAGSSAAPVVDVDVDADVENSATVLRSRLGASQPHGLRMESSSIHAPATPPSSVSTEHWPTKLSWVERVRHLTWAFFTLTMATGGVANVLYSGEKMLPLESIIPISLGNERQEQWLTGSHSAVPIRRTGNHWPYSVYNQHCFLCHYMGSYNTAVLLLPLHVQSVVPTPHRVPVCAGGDCHVRYDPYQYLAVRPGAHGRVASSGCCDSVLV